MYLVLVLAVGVVAGVIVVGYTFFLNNLLVWQGSQRVHCEYSDMEEASSLNSSARPESVKLLSVSSFQRLDSLHNDWKAVRKSSRRLFLISVLLCLIYKYLNTCMHTYIIHTGLG